MVAAPYSASTADSAVACPGPSTTAAGSPSDRAAVSSSRVVFLTTSPAASTSTNTVAMISSLPSSSDELPRHEKLRDLGPAVAFVDDDLPGLAGWRDRELHHLSGGGGQAELFGIEV